MADLILLPTLERLRPYDATGVTAFGLTLSVALEVGKTPGDVPGFGESFLKPWTWGTDESAFLEIGEVLFLPASGAAASEPAPAQRGEPRRPGLQDALGRRFQKFLARGGAETWEWRDPATNPSMKISREVRRWPAFVGEVSLYPWPLPQALGLSYFLELKKDLGPAVVAAPILQLKDIGKLMPRVQTVNGERVTLAYELVPPAPPADPAAPAPPSPPPHPAIVAETIVCKIDETADPRYFDFKNLWVRIGREDVARTDWRAGLELRLAEQLQLGRTILEWMQKENEKLRQAREAARRAGTTLDESQFEVMKQFPVLTWMALLQLRESLGPGLRDAPGGNLLLRARSFWNQGVKPRLFSESAVLAVQSQARIWNQGVNSRKWMGWLREVVTGAALDANGVAAGAGLLEAAVQGDPVDAIGRLTLEQAIGELDQVLAAVSAPPTARALFQIQWKAFVKGNPNIPGAADANDFARALTAELPAEVDLQRLLLLDHLGKHWQDLQAAFAESPTLPEVRAGLRGVYKAILRSLQVPVWTPERLDVLSADFVELVLPKELSSVEPRRTKGLTFQLDTLSTEPRQDEDMLRRIQGVGVLMRRKGAQEWRCLNMAAAHSEGDSAERVLLPARLVYLNNLRSPTVTYDNGPLTVEGPLSPRQVAGTEIRETGKEDEIESPVVKFISSSSATAKIPGLVFGETYQIVPFLVTNSGALPKALSDGKPWKLKESIQNLSDVQPVEREYLREMHVGALRFLSDEPSGLPPIPANVAPQIRELAPEKLLPKGDPLLDRKDPLQRTDAALAGTPLLLLAPAGFPAKPGMEPRSQFGFKILPPTLDLQTWDRWVAKGGDKNRRKFVWRSFYQLAYEKGKVDRKLEDAEVYLDDPAVAGIWAELVRIEKNGTQTRLGIEKIDLKGKPFPSGPGAIRPDFSNWEDATCTLVTEQRKAIDVDCQFINGKLQVALVPGKPPLAGVGRLFRLSFYAFMKPGDEARFLDKENEYVRQDGEKGTSPWHLLIEIPQALPKTEKLQASLRNLLKPELANPATLRIGLDMNADGLADLQGHVYRAELWHQVWSWRGRPPAKHPRLATDGNEREFEMSEFGERSDDEHRRLPMPRLVPDNGASDPFFQYEENLAEQGPQGDLRALHHRFSTRVFSRWEGILPEEDSYLEAMEEKTRVRWKPLFVPCRHRIKEEAPAPKIKLVLPLTQGEPEKAAGGPGLLVVVDGSWYEVGGLAEKLDVEVMRVTTGPDTDPDQPIPKPEYFQIGTDPIITKDGAGTFLGSTGALPTDNSLIQFTQIDGAIGHHRDHSQIAPRFLASSFLLSRPTISINAQAREVDLSWWFLKLRFCRSLQVGGVGETVASEWSAPFWVQILPGVERVEEEWFGGGDLDVTLNGGQLTVRPLAGPVPLANRESFHLFGVMTRKVIDFAGRPDQEVYLGVWRKEGGQWRTDVTINPSEDLYIRWIEVQGWKLSGINSGDELWKRIFAPDQPDAQRARIVRISKRFCVNRRCP